MSKKSKNMLDHIAIFGALQSLVGRWQGNVLMAMHYCQSTISLA